jgi:ABC-2 type transport system permease protein
MLSNFPYLKRLTYTLLTTYYAEMVEYRAELFFWALSNSFPLILMGVWIEASQDNRFGLTPITFARYFLSVFIIRQVNVAWVIWDFEREVVEGKLSHRLMQPLDPFWHHFATHIAEKFARVPFILALIALFFILYPQSFWIPHLGSVLFVLIFVPIAYLLRFLIQYTFAMMAFWTERASAIEQFWFLPYLFLSGMIAPLDVFPEALRQILLWTPFPYMLYFPAAMLVGMPVNVPLAILVVILWLVGIYLLNRWLWRKGLKHYSGMGA